MFDKCRKLTTIYASEKFMTTNVNDKNGKQMFIDCKELIGENNTKYQAGKYNKEYAHIDSVDTPGYFKYKE